MTRRTLVRAATVVVAGCAAVMPIPEAQVERWYSLRLFPRVQAAVTTASNQVPVALLDIAILVLIAWAGFRLVRRIRAQGARASLRHLPMDVAVISAVVYLLFLGMWGLNYRRLPLESKLVFDRARVTRESVAQLGRDATAEINSLFEPARGPRRGEPTLESAFATAQRLLGSTHSALPGIPKRSLLTLYFRRAAVDGMTDPLFLEIILNPEVLPAERPAVLAHEWAHLAGYADESEANFVAWLTCVHGDSAARYSGWLAVYQHVSASLPAPERRALEKLVAPGPMEDLRAIEERYRRASPAVRSAARGAYDSYLRANRVEEGIHSYAMVVQLMLGTRFDPDWKPQMR
ncbi:MAG: DUF3810 domain-containing protein [Acidobacteria bacterium]|nr:DUF3810 domain-containing protein [Acidobacteriota bacterium]